MAPGSSLTVEVLQRGHALVALGGSECSTRRRLQGQKDLERVSLAVRLDPPGGVYNVWKF